MYSIERYHDISCGHRVHGHESKCARLHGHNYRIFFRVVNKENELDSIGRVVDFSDIKLLLCEWVEVNWDHKFLVHRKDPMGRALEELFGDDIVLTPFNPTAEEMAKYLVEVIGPLLLPSYLELVECRVEETRKCSATYRKASAG